MEIYIIRHTTPNVEADICYGISDIDLNSNYPAERTVIAKQLSDFKPDFVFSSPLKRCLTLATDLFGEKEIIVRDELKELDFGTWEMKPWSEIPLNELDPWAADFFNNGPPMGESFGNLDKRAGLFLKHIESLPADSRLAVVTHSGVIRSFLMHFLAIPHTHIFNLKLDYGTIVKVSISGKRVQIEFLK